MTAIGDAKCDPKDLEIRTISVTLESFQRQIDTLVNTVDPCQEKKGTHASMRGNEIFLSGN